MWRLDVFQLTRDKPGVNMAGWAMKIEIWVGGCPCDPELQRDVGSAWRGSGNEA